MFKVIDCIASSTTVYSTLEEALKEGYRCTEELAKKLSYKSVVLEPSPSFGDILFMGDVEDDHGEVIDCEPLVYIEWPSMPSRARYVVGEKWS